jgi:transposase
LQRAAEERADGLNFDEVYVGALRGLRSRAVAQSLAPVSSVTERQSQLNQLPPEERQRLAMRRQADLARRRSAERRGGPDHSQNP